MDELNVETPGRKGGFVETMEVSLSQTSTGCCGEPASLGEPGKVGSSGCCGEPASTAQSGGCCGEPVGMSASEAQAGGCCGEPVAAAADTGSRSGGCCGEPTV